MASSSAHDWRTWQVMRRTGEERCRNCTESERQECFMVQDGIACMECRRFGFSCDFDTLGNRDQWSDELRERVERIETAEIARMQAYGEEDSDVELQQEVTEHPDPQPAPLPIPLAFSPIASSGRNHVIAASSIIGGMTSSAYTGSSQTPLATIQSPRRLGVRAASHVPDQNNRYSDVDAKSTALIQSMMNIWSSDSRTYSTIPQKNSHQRMQALSILSQDEARLQLLHETLSEACLQLQKELKVLRNVLNPFHTLPEHILLRIFQFTTSPDQWQGGPCNNAKSILHISRTCSRWRNIALKFPGLWSTLYLNGLSYVDATIYTRHSKQASLQLYAANTTPHRFNQSHDPIALTSLLRSCSSLLPRISDLILDYERPDHIPQWLIHVKMPRIRTVQLTFHGDSEEPCHTLRSLLNGGKLGLESLTLENVFVPWASLVQCPLLTKLHVEFTNRPGPELALQDSGILRVLRACPRLQDLHISCQDFLRDLPGIPDHPIPLLRLTKLTLQLAVPDLVFILQSIAVPRDISMMFLNGVYNGYQEKDPNSVIYLPSDPQCLPSLNLISEMKVRLEGRCIEGCFESSVAPPRHFRIAVYPREDIVDWEPTALEVTVKATASMFSHMQKYYIMPYLKVLTINDAENHRYLEIENLVLLLRNSPLLENLHIERCDAVLLETLAKHWKYSPIPLCPALTGVEISQMQLKSPVLKAFYEAYFDTDFTNAFDPNILGEPIYLRRAYRGKERSLVLHGTVLVIPASVR